MMRWRMPPYIFTEEQLKKFLYRAIIGANEDGYLKNTLLAEEFLGQFNIGVAYEELMETEFEELKEEISTRES